MQIALLQLNIESGHFLDAVISFIKQHNFDIVQLQEVSGGTFNRYHYIDNFEDIKEKLGYNGVLTKTATHVTDESSYFGKATFFKPSFTLLSQEVVWLSPFTKLNNFPKQPEDIKQLPHSTLHIRLQKEGRVINCVNTHLAWGPNPKDEPYKLDQAKILVEYMKNMETPFFLSGDFNVTPDSQIALWFDELGNNLITENHITNTLNPHIHRAKELFPKGLAVDYVYVSKDIIVKNFQVIQEDLSDHLGLMCEIEI